jgi:hypothetical protein
MLFFGYACILYFLILFWYLYASSQTWHILDYALSAGAVTTPQCIIDRLLNRDQLVVHTRSNLCFTRNGVGMAHLSHVSYIPCWCRVKPLLCEPHGDFVEPKSGSPWQSLLNRLYRQYIQTASRLCGRAASSGET